MGLPAIAAAYGIGSAALGIGQSRQAAKKAKGAIKLAYSQLRKDQAVDQGDIRQSVTESLNARGLLGTGQGGGVSTALPDDKRYKGPAMVAGLPMGQIINNKAAKQHAEYAAQANRNAVGQSGTLAGQTSADLSGEFMKEQYDLDRERKAVLDGVDAQHMNDVAGAIGNGIAGAYQVGSMMTPAAGAPVGATPPIVPAAGYDISGAYGIDPIDPLSSVSNFQFRVAPRPENF